MPRLLTAIEDGGISRREWLSTVPSSKAAKGLAEQIGKVDFLKEMGADRLVCRISRLLVWNISRDG